MLSVFVREQKRYYKNELTKLLKMKPDEFAVFIRRMKSFGIIKMVRAIPEERELSELTDNEIELVNDEEDIENHFYIFTYVGILTVGNCILKCYPKYISSNEPLKEMKQVLQVLRKYNAKQQNVNIYSGEAENVTFNMLAVMLYFLEDYMENGEYTNQQINIETNGEGEILWDQTIDQTFALIKNNRPYYMEVKTISVDEDKQDFFRRLHRCIVTECSKQIEEANISELFDLDTVDDSENILEDFGDGEYILYRIRKELDIQYNDRKKLILKTMYAYISRRNVFDNGLGLSMFGTNSFNLVWESVCAEVFGNCLNQKVNNLPLTTDNDYFVNETRRLIELIEKPKWRFKNTDTVIEQQKTLIPDLISIYQFQNSYCFSILDAKYYSVKLNKNEILGQPGVGDVTKQYLYQLAYQDFINKAGYMFVQNAFLVPGDIELGEYLGRAEFNMMVNAGRGNLEHISVLKLPASKMYAAYISGKEDSELLHILQEAPHQKRESENFTSRIFSYFNKGKVEVTSRGNDLHQESIIRYPDKIRGNIGAKILFDIIAPEIAKNACGYMTYVSSEKSNCVADVFDDIKTEETVIELIMEITDEYLQYISNNIVDYSETLAWTNEYILSHLEFMNVTNVTEKLAETIFALYN